MFKHEMREQRDNFIKMIDTDPKVLDEMLRFIYTGKVSDIDEMATDLLEAADKYDLQRLKIMCEEKLYTTVNVETAAHIFAIADRYNCKQLKTLIGSFMSERVKDVIRTEGYRVMFQSNGMLPIFCNRCTHEIGYGIRDSDGQRPKYKSISLFFSSEFICSSASNSR